MASYRFFPPANEAQDDIWQYTYDEWGESQAKKYIIELHDHLQALADKKKTWRTLPNSLIVPPDLDISAYFSRYECHYIFFRELSAGTIGVLSILHESMDIPVRLFKDLEKIETEEE